MMKTMIALTLVGILCFPFSAKSENLSAKDLARAMGVDWWSVRLPEGDQPLMLRFVLKNSDGTKNYSGAMGFPPGITIKVYCWPAEDKEWLKVSITSEKSVMKTMIKNPFSKAKVVAYPVQIGDTTDLGQFLIKGSKEREVTSEQSLKDGEFGLFVEEKP